MTPPPPPRDVNDGPAGLADLLRGLARRIDQSPADAPDQVVREVLLDLFVLGGRVEAETLVWLSVFDAKTIWAGDGARSAGGWVGARTEVPTRVASAMTATARTLRACPAVEAAYRSGLLGKAKVQALLDARDAYPDLFAEHEEGLVAEVVPLTVTDAKIAIARWEALATATRDADDRERAGEHPDEPGDEPPADPADSNRLHHSRMLDGRWMGDHDLDPVTGAEEDAAVQAEIDRRFQTGVYFDGDGIPAAKRRADCRHALIMRGALAGIRHGDPRPSVSLHLDAKTALGEPVESLEDLRSRLCELDDGTQIPLRTAERLLCNARVSVMLEMLDKGQIEVIGITDQLRDATARQRRALKRLYGGCAFTGCTAPFDWCEAHHLIPFEVGGVTLLANLVPLCSHHHHLVHEGGFTLWRHTDGRLYLTRPDGTHLPMTTPGTKADVTPPTDGPPPPAPLQQRAERRFLTKREKHDREHHRRQTQRRERDRGDPDTQAA